VTNTEFTRALGAAVHRPAILRAPYFLLKLAMGEFAEVLFASQRAVPKAAVDHGFRFEHPEIAGALAASL
jgi:NAD dependent epimerase/dehydratase family enzyme